MGIEVDSRPHGFIITFREAHDGVDPTEGISMISSAIPRLAVHTELVASDGSSVPYLFDNDAWFKGGPVALTQYFAEQVAYPESALKRSGESQFDVTFTIGRAGQIVELRIDGHDRYGFIPALEEAFHKMPEWEPAVRKGIKVNSRKNARVIFQHNDEGGEVKFLLSGPGYPTLHLENLLDEYRELYLDPAVSNAFERNDWKNASVVMDVTGSMSPYSTQLLLWQKLHPGKLNLTVFNDGDE